MASTIATWVATGLVLAAGESALADAEPPIGGEGAKADYTRALHARVHSRWAENFLAMASAQLPKEHAVNDPTRRAVLEVVLAANGKLVSSRVQSGSGASEFDAAAVEVLESSGPFAASPEEALSDDGQAHLTWAFARDDRRCSELAVVDKVSPLAEAVPRLIEGKREREALRRVRAAADAGALEVFARAWLKRAMANDAGVRHVVRGIVAAEHKRVEVVAHPTGSRAAIYKLTSLLRDKSPEVRIQAMVDLLRTGGEDMLAQLYLLFKEKDARPYERVAAVLGDMSGDESAKTLGRMLRKQDRRIRAAGAAALAGRRDEPARRELALLLADSDAAMRFYASAAADAGARRQMAESVGGAGQGAFVALARGAGRDAAGFWLLANFDRAEPRTRVELLARWLGSAGDASELLTALGAQ